MASLSVPPPLVPERGLLLRVAATATVVVALIALVAGIAGAQLAERRALAGVANRADVLVRALAPRIREAPPERRGALTRAMARVGGVVTLVDTVGFAVADAIPSPVPARDPLYQREHIREERTVDAQRYFVASEALILENTRHVFVVAIPISTNPGAVPRLLGDLLSVLAAIGALGVAAAIVMARDIATDVGAITRRALQMSSREAAALEPLPVRAADEVGELVTAFNLLQRKFSETLKEHRVALQRLEDAERRKEALIATLRHELRTPLNSVIGFADLLLSGVDGELTPVQREDVEVIARSGRHLLHLVDDVLDLSALASGRFSIEKAPVDLVPLAKEVAREAAGAARKKRVDVVVEAAVANAIVDGDATSLRRAITNLVQNAVDYAGGRVVIEVQCKGRNAVLSVKDNGPGIRPQDLKRLFKPFERGRTGEASRTNAGLGLAITLALLELHGGQLSAESELGAGSTFTATIPLRPEALAQAGFA